MLRTRLLLSVAVLLLLAVAASPAGARAAECPPLEPSAEAFRVFIEEGCFRSWQHDPEPRLSGALGADGTPYTVHGRFQVYYSPPMVEWMALEREPEDRPPGRPALAVPDGAAMIAEIFPVEDGGDPSSVGYVFMLRDDTASVDGWFWGRYRPGAEQAALRAEFGFSYCVACHASAASDLTYADHRNLRRTPAVPTDYTPPPEPGKPLTPVLVPASNRLSQPLDDTGAQRFIDFFNGAVPGLDLPPARELPAAAVAALPPRLLDHVFLSAEEVFPQIERPIQFLTSDQCQGCHDGTELLSNTRPNMIFEADDAQPGGPHLIDWSQYGEWNVSLMGLAGRDPVFLAQAETERMLKPGVDGNLIDNVCYSCHGSMGPRQYHLDRTSDTPPAFSHYMIFSTPADSEFRRRHGDRPPYDNPLAAPRFAEYGALGRDGVSCAVCHHIGPADGSTQPASGADAPASFWEIFYGPEDPSISTREDPPGPPHPFDATFAVDTSTLFAPCPQGDCPETDADQPGPDSVEGYAHGQALDMDVVQQDYVSQAELCGSCHVVLVPQVPDDYAGNPLTDGRVGLSYEQATYFEWVVSEYAAQGLECQGCHMPEVSTGVRARPATTLDIVNIESSAYPPVSYRAPDPSVTPTNGDGLEARRYARHRLLGINLFVHEMFQQFHDLLGLENPRDADVPEGTVLNLLDAKRSIIEHAIGDPPTAEVAVCGFREDGESLVAELLVANNAGHKFPTGAGFRRAWVRLEVLGADGDVLWSSGAFNGFGALLDGEGEVLESELTKDPMRLQPHYNRIDRQDQVQIYEVRSLGCRPVPEQGGAFDLTRCDCPGPAGRLNNCVADGDGFLPPRLTTSTLTLFHDVKDNRVLPRGWSLNLLPTMKGLEVETLENVTEAELRELTPPYRPIDDPHYSRENPYLAGTDRIVYEVRRGDLPPEAEPAKVRVSLHYQTIPPYFLVDRFQDGKELVAKGRLARGHQGFGTATERLIYVTSHLDSVVTTPRELEELLQAGDLPPDVSRDWTMTLSQATHDLTGDATLDLCDRYTEALERRHDHLLKTLRSAGGSTPEAPGSHLIRQPEDP